jgi:ribonuclease-3
LSDRNDITGLEAVLGHRFTRPDLLEQALTHSSHAHEAGGEEFADHHPSKRDRDNEQLEFLGDAVLGLTTSEALFQRFPSFNEGQLSKIRAHLVSERHLVRAATTLGIGDFLFLGRGEEKSGGRQKPALLVDALEAIVAALYLDAGFETARAFILKNIVDPELSRLEASNSAGVAVSDFKSALQEALQSAGRPQPMYVVTREEGPDHRKQFTVEARIMPGSGGAPEYVARAAASTKKQAEQLAAEQALEHLRSHPLVHDQAD